MQGCGLTFLKISHVWWLWMVIMFEVIDWMLSKLFHGVFITATGFSQEKNSRVQYLIFEHVALNEIIHTCLGKLFPITSFRAFMFES